ncbi:MAG: DNA-processing protein DprA [Sphingomonadales bacterium]|nr:DNA-processing protein DprA [Sphingomonadales bacterium]
MNSTAGPVAAETFARLRLLRSSRVGPIAYRQLLRRFGSARAALDALPDLAARGRGEGARQAARTAYAAAPAARIEAELATVARLGARHLFEGDADFPALLSRAEGAPPILIVRGDPVLARRTPVAIVGARNASAGACRLARDIARDLALQGHAVVSGLARGVDGAAHTGALQAAAAGTIAVIANGHDLAYPREHADLQDRIAREGLLLSEYPPGTEPLARQFPARNRIIAALSLGTVVAEAAPRSGSLVTARLAGEYGREVMAIPGSPLDPRSQGCNLLIRDGATLVQDAADVIEAITGFGGQSPRSLFDTVAEAPRASAHQPDAPADAPADDPAFVAEIAQLLGHAPVAVDELVRTSAAPAPAVQQALVELELAGRLQRHAGAKVSLAPLD